MSETYVTSSAEFKKFVNGHLVKDIEFSTDYDGDIADIQFRDDDEEYYTQLDNNSLLELLNASRNSKSLVLRLEEEFPLKNNEYSTKKKKKTKKQKKIKKQKKTKKQK